MCLRTMTGDLVPARQRANCGGGLVEVRAAPGPPATEAPPHVMMRRGRMRGGLGTRLRGVGVGTRKSVATLGATELSDLRDAFAAVYGLRDDRGYAFYAGLHGLPLPAYCQHGTLLFLPWHRAYLYFFERALTDALRRARDDQAVAVTLPWWDWTSSSAHADGLPAGYLAQPGAA